MHGESRGTVVKVGGSLYDLLDLGPRLWGWLSRLDASSVLLVPGGGPTADVIRAFDHCHALGEEIAHELALRSLTLNAWFLSSLLAGSGQPSAISPRFPVCNPLASPGNRFCVLDAHAFWESDRLTNPGAMPACWDATSDSLAARVAVVLGAGELILLKSVSVPPSCDWIEASRLGLVDPLFPRFLQESPLRVRVVNLREWQP